PAGLGSEVDGGDDSGRVGVPGCVRGLAFDHGVSFVRVQRNGLRWLLIVYVNMCMYTIINTSLVLSTSPIPGAPARQRRLLIAVPSSLLTTTESGAFRKRRRQRRQPDDDKGVAFVAFGDLHRGSQDSA
ncbi:MAG: hypothetical protein ACREO8_04310, partial [Luteimonas sp.]